MLCKCRAGANETGVDLGHDLSIIIVSYNTRQMLLDCLRSVYASPGQCSLQVIVVDNGSVDGSAGAVRQQYPQATLIESESNLGFSRASNLGMSRADGRYLMLLNSDAEVVGEALGQLLEFADRHPNAGAIGPKLLNSDLTDQGVARSFPTPMAAFFGRKSPLSCFWPNNPFTKRYLLGRYHQGDQPFDVDSLSGACLMVPRKAAEEVGLLDEGYYMYWEDIDWCRRLKGAGWRVCCVPAARVIHHEGQSSHKRRDHLIIEFHRSAYRYYCKHHAPSLWNPLRWVAASALSVRAVALLAWNQVPRSPSRDRLQAPAGVSTRGKQTELCASNHSSRRRP